MLAGALFVAGSEHRQYVNRVRAQVISGLSEKRATLESALATRLSLVDGMAALAVAHDGDIAAEFDAFAVGLAGSHRSFLGRQGSDPAVRSIQLAPDGVVTYVWPVEGNEEAIGHDLLADPERGPAVERSIRERRFILAGPFELLQGGSGLVGRSPIFLETDDGSDEFWGFATVVINFDEIASEAGLDSPVSGDTLYAVRGRDGLGEQGEVFLGSAHAFDHDPVLMDVVVPNGTWQIGAHPVGGWPLPQDRATPIIITVTGILLAAMVSTLIWRATSARRSLERVSDDLYRLIHSTSSPIIGIELDGTISEFNKGAGRLLAVGREEAVGSDLQTVLQNASCSRKCIENLHAAVTGAFAGKSSEDVRVILPGATTTILSFTVTPRLRSDGSSAGAVCIGQDITSRVELEEIRAENIAMTRSARLKDEFLAGMSHELRTPLNAIIGLSRVLNRETFGPLTDRQESYVRQIGESGEHLLALINDVLDLAKIDSNGGELNIERVEVNAVATEAIAMIAPLVEERSQNVTGPPVDAEQAVIFADRRRVRQIALNLLSNAVKFSPEGGQLGIEVAKTDDGVEIAVWDHGIGVPEEARHLLFEPFQQVDGSLSREHDGTGLGLALVAKLVALHGGAVDLESRPGVGSRFVVRLPHRPPKIAMARVGVSSGA